MYNVIDLQSKIYKVGIYIRLSKEDLDKIGNESYSVVNQKTLLENYVKEHGYILVDAYIDDGYTGTNFNRPGFIRMIKDIELGKIDMVITKDLSRLGRDYIETGEYVEKYFPTHKVRYVSLIDGIDTIVDNSNNDIAPFKAVINDMYSRDNSKKIRTALHTLQKEGKWVGGCTPLGYMPDPLDKNHLVPNENESYIVKKIFDLAVNGKTVYQIKEILNDENIPTATQLRKSRGRSFMAEKGIWSTKTVYNILKNNLYTGDMVQNRGSRISYKIRKNVRNDKSDWIIVPNTHEPLVDKNTFEEVQKILSKCKIKSNKEIYRLLDGILYCAECGHRISICKPRKSDNKTYTVCNTYRMHSKLKLCTTHSNNYDVLEEEVLKQLKKIFSLSLDKNVIKDKINSIYNKENSKNDLNALLDSLENKISSKQDQLDKMYIDKLEDKITEDMYNRVKVKLEIEIAKFKNEREDIQTKIISNTSENQKNDECESLVREFLKLENPSKSLIIRLINRIDIHQNKDIDIHFNFNKLNYFLSEKSS